MLLKLPVWLTGIAVSGMILLRVIQNTSNTSSLYIFWYMVYMDNFIVFLYDNSDYNLDRKDAGIVKNKEEGKHVQQRAAFTKLYISTF